MTSGAQHLAVAESNFDKLIHLIQVHTGDVPREQASAGELERLDAMTSLDSMIQNTTALVVAEAQLAQARFMKDIAANIEGVRRAVLSS